MRYRVAAPISTILAIATATLALPAPASAVAPGVQVQITQVPRTFAVGADADAVTVVASSRGGGQCRKVRWSMLVRVQGVPLDQVHVDRLEGDKSFPIKVEAQGDTAARLTDVAFDPGQLCSGGTVTATYAFAFTGGAGSVTFQGEAFDAADRLLQSASASSRVVNGDGQAAADPPPAAADPPPAAADPAQSSAAANPAPDPSTSGDTGDDAAAGDTDDPSSTPPAAADIAQNPAAAVGSAPSLLGPGLIIGAVLVFLGVALLLRLRLRNRGPKNGHLPPTSFYPAP